MHTNHRRKNKRKTTPWYGVVTTRWYRTLRWRARRRRVRLQIEASRYADIAPVYRRDALWNLL